MEWPIYAAGVSGAIAGGWIAIRRARNSQSKVLRPWLFSALGITTATFGILFLQNIHIPQDWKELTGLIFGFGLILQVVLTISGIMLGSIRLVSVAIVSRRDA